VTASDLPPFPPAETPAERQVLADIVEYGWHCVLVADEHHSHHAAENAALPPHEVYDAAFAYTVGVWGTFRHPELVLVGRWQHAHGYLNVLVEMIREGHRFGPGDSTDEVLEGYEVRLGAVSESRRLELLTWTDWANAREPFEALQVILPDRAGRWPSDPDYEGFSQPLLNS
jgi:hypothetical protein